MKNPRARWIGAGAIVLSACGGVSAPTDAAADTAISSRDAHDGMTDASLGCGIAMSAYPANATTEGSVTHDGMTRTFRVHVPPGYDASSARPLVLMLHGGAGSGLQFETASSEMDVVADREGFIAVYPDGTGRLQTWNAGGCCGGAVTDDVDDVGFIAALLDHLEGALCLDRDRVFAAGMSNGGLMSHRLACELSERFAAVAPVAGPEMSPTCVPTRQVPVMHIHGTADGHVPFEGGVGCGPSGVAFTSVPATMERRRTINGCDATTSRVLTEGDGTCEGYDGCDADTVVCSVEGGGHSWPGGAPSMGRIDCPGNGEQSTTFVASEVIWRFFAAHPRP